MKTVFSLNKTQFKIVYNMYNKNQTSLVLSNLTEVNQAYGLADRNSDMFQIEAINGSFRDTRLTVSKGFDLLPLIKYNSKFETEPGIKDETKIKQFLKKLKAHGSEILS